MGFNTRVVLGIIVFGVRVLVVGVWVYLCIQEEVGGEDVCGASDIIRYHFSLCTCPLFFSPSH